MQSSYLLQRWRGLSQLAIVVAMLLGGPAWFSSSRAESDEAPQEVKKCTEVLACTSHGRRRESQATSSTYFRSGCCLSQACIERRQPAPERSGHRLSDELLAPLIC